MRLGALIIALVVLAAGPLFAAEELWWSEESDQADTILAAETVVETYDEKTEGSFPQVPLDGASAPADEDVGIELEGSGSGASGGTVGTEVGPNKDVGTEVGVGEYGDGGIGDDSDSVTESDPFYGPVDENSPFRGSGEEDLSDKPNGEFSGENTGDEGSEALDDGATDEYRELPEDAFGENGEYYGEPGDGDGFGDGGGSADTQADSIDEIGLSAQVRSDIDQVDRAGRASMDRMTMDPTEARMGVLQSANDQAMRELSMLAELARGEGSEETAGAAEALMKRRQERYSEMIGKLNVAVRRDRLREMDDGGDGSSTWQEQRREELRRRRQRQEEMQRQGGYEIYTN